MLILLIHVYWLYTKQHFSLLHNMFMYIGANFENLVSCMADGTLKFELLAVDPKNQVKAFQEDVNDVFHKSSGCFVLYNCARITTILKKFEKSVNEGIKNGCMYCIMHSFGELGKPLIQ